MQHIQLRNDTLIEIGTFLVRRWSGKDNLVIEFSNKTQNETRLKENKVRLCQLTNIMEIVFKNIGS